MKHLKRFNEKVIQPYDFTISLEKLRGNNNITLEDLSDVFNHMDVEFVNVEYFISKLQTKKEIEMVPVNMPPLLGGIRWGAHNVYTNKMYICIDEEVFLKSINSKNKNQMLDFLEEILRHESVHKQQAERRPNIILRNLETSPKDTKKYFSSTDEVMAFADSFIVQCRKKGLSDDDILDSLRDGKKVSWIQNVYSGMDSETQKRFKKYVYQYIRN
jgi:hypothetical protein